MSIIQRFISLFQYQPRYKWELEKWVTDKQLFMHYRCVFKGYRFTFYAEGSITYINVVRGSEVVIKRHRIWDYPYIHDAKALRRADGFVDEFLEIQQ